MDEKYFIAGFCVWAAKEIYSSFKGSRAKTILALSKVKLEMVEIQFRMRMLAERLDKIEKALTRLYEDRRYRK